MKQKMRDFLESTNLKEEEIRGFRCFGMINGHWRIGASLENGKDQENGERRLCMRGRKDENEREREIERVVCVCVCV